jgi:hypothetical protein
VINRMTGEPILLARTADQYLARYWSAVRAGKIGSPVMRFIINPVPPAGGRDSCTFGADLRVCGLWVRSRSLAANHAGGPGHILLPA